MEYMDNPLQKELNYFKTNQKELLRQYVGKFLVIKNQKVEGVYDSEIEAYDKAQKNFKLGSFLIQKCVPGKESYTQTFYSRLEIHG